MRALLVSTYEMGRQPFGLASPAAWLRDAGVDGLERARAVDHVEEIVITARRDQRIHPLPESGSYLGVIFARAESPDGVVPASRAAHSRLTFEIAAPISIL